MLFTTKPSFPARETAILITVCVCLCARVLMHTHVLFLHVRECKDVLSLLWGPPVFTFPGWNYRQVVMLSGNPNPPLHACKVSTLITKPSLQFLKTDHDLLVINELLGLFCFVFSWTKVDLRSITSAGQPWL